MTRGIHDDRAASAESSVPGISTSMPDAMPTLHANSVIRKASSPKISVLHEVYALPFVPVYSAWSETYRFWNPMLCLTVPANRAVTAVTDGLGASRGPKDVFRSHAMQQGRAPSGPTL